LIVRPPELHQLGSTRGVDVLKCRRCLIENTRKPAGRHERVAHPGHVVPVLVVLHEHGLPEQITQGHPQLSCNISEPIKSTNITLAALDLAEPILREAHEVR